MLGAIIGAIAKMKKEGKGYAKHRAMETKDRASAVKSAFELAKSGKIVEGAQAARKAKKKKKKYSGFADYYFNREE